LQVTSAGSHENKVQRPAVQEGSTGPKPSAVQVSAKQFGRSHFGGFSVPGSPMQLQQSLTALQSAGSLHSATAGAPDPVDAFDDEAVADEDDGPVVASLDDALVSPVPAPVDEAVAPPEPPSLVEDVPQPVETRSAVQRNESAKRPKRMPHFRTSGAPP
jgi:hypothetical protein